MSAPLITALPYWFRLQQCVRRFYDAGIFCFSVFLVCCLCAAVLVSMPGVLLCIVIKSDNTLVYVFRRSKSESADAIPSERGKVLLFFIGAQNPSQRTLHLLNAGKYGCSLAATCIAALGSSVFPVCS